MYEIDFRPRRFVKSEVFNKQIECWAGAQCEYWGYKNCLFKQSSLLREIEYHQQRFKEQE